MASYAGRKVLAAGTCFELEAVRQEAVRLHAKHETWLRGRFEWLKNPANDLTRDLEAGDVSIAHIQWRNTKSQRRAGCAGMNRVSVLARGGEQRRIAVAACWGCSWATSTKLQC